MAITQSALWNPYECEPYTSGGHQSPWCRTGLQTRTKATKINQRNHPKWLLQLKYFLAPRKLEDVCYLHSQQDDRDLRSLVPPENKGSTSDPEQLEVGVEEIK